MMSKPCCDGCERTDVDMTPYICNVCRNSFVLCILCVRPPRFYRKIWQKEKPLPRKNLCPECATKQWEARNG